MLTCVTVGASGKGNSDVDQRSALWKITQKGLQTKHLYAKISFKQHSCSHAHLWLSEELAWLKVGFCRAVLAVVLWHFSPVWCVTSSLHTDLMLPQRKPHERHSHRLYVHHDLFMKTALTAHFALIKTLFLTRGLDVKTLAFFSWSCVKS